MDKIDYNDSLDLIPLANELISLSDKYASKRMDFAKAKYSLEIILKDCLPEIRKKRSNIGYDMALIYLLEMHDGNESVKVLYENVITCEAEFKGIERQLDARQQKLSVGQSIMKYSLQQGG